MGPTGRRPKLRPPTLASRNRECRNGFLRTEPGWDPGPLPGVGGMPPPGSSADGLPEPEILPTFPIVQVTEGYAGYTEQG